MMQTTARNRGILPAYENARQFVHDLHGAGATLVAGTDANSAPGAPATVPHGDGLHDELRLLVEAGLTPMEALRAATSTAAAAFGWSDGGIIRAGVRSNLVLVGGDPTSDIDTIRDIRQVWMGAQASAG